MAVYKRKITKKSTILKNKRLIKTHERHLLENLEQRISLNVDSFLVLSEEGDPTQIALAHQKAKNDFMKLGPQMYQIAQKVGGDVPIVVADFLESIDTVLHGQGMLNEDLISHCLDSSARLRSCLHSR